VESSHFCQSVLHVALYKTLFFDFWFRLPIAQNLLPKICTKSPISWLVWQIDRRCLHLPGGFRGWPIQWNRAKCCGADSCCHGNKIWASRGDLVAYRLVLFCCSQARGRFVRDVGVVDRSKVGHVRSGCHPVLPHLHCWQDRASVVHVQRHHRRTAQLRRVGIDESNWWYAAADGRWSIAGSLMCNISPRFTYLLT